MLRCLINNDLQMVGVGAAFYTNTRRTALFEYYRRSFSNWYLAEDTFGELGLENVLFDSPNGIADALLCCLFLG